MQWLEFSCISIYIKCPPCACNWFGSEVSSSEQVVADSINKSRDLENKEKRYSIQPRDSEKSKPRKEKLQTSVKESWIGVSVIAISG